MFDYHWKLVFLIVFILFVPLSGFLPTMGTAGEFEIIVIDEDTEKPIAVRMHLKDQRGKPVVPRREVGWKDHFVFQHKTVLNLPTGNYTFEMERGPEYKLRQGYFTIERGATDNRTIRMQRFADLKKEGWWSGDLHIHRRPEDIELLMMAEDLHIAPVITWWNKKNLWTERALPKTAWHRFADDHFYHLLAGEDERAGGALLYFNLPKPIEITAAEKEFPSSATFLMAAKGQQGAHVDIEKPFWWDMPMWIASGQVHSIGICHNHMWRDGVLSNEAWGKSRDKFRFPNPQGNGRWTWQIYHHLLNCGIRIPPSAGSASGVLPNPVGYNRVYVYCGDELTPEAWFAGLRAGQVVVTNGPLIRNPRANGELPGHVFKATEGQEVALSITLNLSLREKVQYFEVIQNGTVVHEVRLDDWAKSGGKLPQVRFDKSGWCLVRAVADHPKTLRFAMSGPFYVEIGEKPRISRESAQFFVDWVRERAEQIKIADPNQREQVIRFHRAARDFWKAKLADANVD